MATETELTFASLEGVSTPDLIGKTPILNRQGYVPTTGTDGFHVHFNYSTRYDTALMHLSMQGKKASVIEIPNPTNPDGFDLNRLVEQKDFFLRPKGSRKDYVGEFFIGQLADGRKSELRSIMSPDAANMCSIGVKMDFIDPTTGKISTASRIECERKSIDIAIAQQVLDRFCAGREVAKEFYDMPDEPAAGVHCYFQQFRDKANRGLVLAEFEMSEAVARTFKPPSWLKESFDVTAIPSFRTQALAVGGGMWRSVFNRLNQVTNVFSRDVLSLMEPQQP